MGKRYKKKSYFLQVFSRLRKNKLAMLGFVILVAFILMAVFADVIADYEEEAIKMNPSPEMINQGPSMEHPFGTDMFGRDIFARIVHGSRISLTMGVVAMAGAVMVGALIGAVAGYYGGTVDDIIMRIMDILLAIPPILMSISIVAAFGQSMTNLLFALAVAYVPVFARVIRSSILSVKEQEFVEAAKACGTSDARVILRHIVPNAIGPIIVQATLAMGSTILIISSLSFMGLGVAPPTPEWGTMLYEGRDYIRHVPHVIIFPGITIALAVMSLNLLGDGLRDALDPRLKN